MEILLQDNLSHQVAPVMSIADVVGETRMAESVDEHQNPQLFDALSAYGLHKVWERNNIHGAYRQHVVSPETYRTKAKDLPRFQMMDIKMETGTGKTYVYTQAMFELHKRFGFNKFIVAVPSLAIKAGASSFLGDAYVMHHFSDACGYGAQIELCLVEAQKKKKKGRQNFPTSVARFFYGSKHDRNKIFVLLVNTQLLTGNSKVLTGDEYDQMLEDFHVPVDAISHTRPVLIIDEPHKMARETDTFKKLIGRLQPQLVLRYGATFPRVTIGKGKRKETVTDYVNLIYDLNACEAFNSTLIKGIAKETPKLPGGARMDKKVTVVSIDKKSKSAKLKLETETDRREVTLHDVGYDLCNLDEDLRGITFEGLDKSGRVCLSNGVELNERDVVFTDLYSTSYQEEMIKLALHRHFETERMNYHRHPTRIKTLALFFIDNIESYRGDGKKEGWLKTKFKQLLKAQLETELMAEDSEGYKAYLQATLDDLDGACAGYFARDNQDSDERIEEEVRLILHGKKELLSFDDEKGRPNICRFLFSKWTLKEGWDNPNVFTICKLRSSGSEISKLQEVGRGLRLPVDEVGNRIQESSFTLNYIVDFTEKKFASQLVAEINGYVAENEGVREIVLTSEVMSRVAKQRGTEVFLLFAELLTKRYVDQDKKVYLDKLEEFLADYPEFSSLSAGRVIDRDKKSKPVRIRKVQFRQLEELWHKLNRKYIMYFDHEIEDGLRSDLPGLIIKNDVFGIQVVTTDRNRIVIDHGRAVAVEDGAYQFNSASRFLPYNEFLKRVSRKTGVPITLLHESICNAVDGGLKVSDNVFNEGSLARMIGTIGDWKCRELQGLVRYRQTNYETKETKLTNADGTIRDEVVKGDIGSMFKDGTPLAKYLYDSKWYDSDLELQNIESDIESVVVYGKIPKKSVCIPTIASSNYSPDFMYVVKRKNGAETLNIVIESKNYGGKSGLSPDENAKVTCAERLYEKMSEEGIDVKFKKQLNTQQVSDIINSLLQTE